MVKEENFELGTLFRSGKVEMEKRRNDDSLQTIKRELETGEYWQLPKMDGEDIIGVQELLDISSKDSWEECSIYFGVWEMPFR